MGGGGGENERMKIVRESQLPIASGTFLGVLFGVKRIHQNPDQFGSAEVVRILEDSWVRGYGHVHQNIPSSEASVGQL